MSLWWQQLALVMLGGALGAAARFWLGGAMLRQLGSGIPWGTLAANLIGSFLAGFIVVWLEGRGQAALYWRAFLIVGVMGGLTTYSALMIETLLLARSQRTDLMLGYLGGTLVAGFVLVWAGARLAAMLRPPY
jgi:CrcB protein